MGWGDEFAKLVPRWLPRPKGCPCKDLQRKMNELDAESAASLFDDFLAAIVESARGLAILRAVPQGKLEGSIKRRMIQAYEAAFDAEMPRDHLEDNIASDADEESNQAT